MWLVAVVGRCLVGASTVKVTVRQSNLYHYINYSRLPILVKGYIEPNYLLFLYPLD